MHGRTSLRGGARRAGLGAGLGIVTMLTAAPAPVAADAWWCTAGWRYENVSVYLSPVFYTTWATDVWNGNYDRSITASATNTEPRRSPSARRWA